MIIAWLNEKWHQQVDFEICSTAESLLWLKRTFLQFCVNLLFCIVNIWVKIQSGSMHSKIIWAWVSWTIAPHTTWKTTFGMDSATFQSHLWKGIEGGRKAHFSRMPVEMSPSLAISSLSGSIWTKLQGLDTNNIALFFSNQALCFYLFGILSSFAVPCLKCGHGIHFYV